MVKRARNPPPTRETPDPMTTLDVFALAVFAVLVTLVVLRQTRFRNHPWDIYYPKLAWLRGGIYFCCCYLLSYWTGAMRLLVESPLATPEQLADPAWIAFTAGLVVFIFAAYPGVWVYFTPVFERRKNTLASAGASSACPSGAPGSPPS